MACLGLPPLTTKIPPCCRSSFSSHCISPHSNLAWKDTWHTSVGSVLPKFQIVLIQSRKKKSEKTRQEVVIMDEQSAFYVVRKGSSIGVYKSLQDCQSQVSSSVCDPSVSVYKGYSMQKETEEYLSSKGLKNALFSIDAADCREDLFGTLVLCPFQEPESHVFSSKKDPEKPSSPKRIKKMEELKDKRNCRSNPELASTCQEAFEDCVARMIPDVHQQIKVLVDSSLYINKAGRFSSEVAELAVEDLEPIRWWEHFGSRTPELRTYAMRIIGLCCSASSCERNWSTFEHFHTRRRNRLKIERLDDLVFVNYNKKLEERLQRNIMLEEDGKGKFDPIRLEELNLTSEWITNIEGESEEFVYTEEGLTWSMVEGAAGEYPGLSTRSDQARPFTTQAPFSSEVCERFRRTYQRSKRRMQPRMLEEIEEEE